MLTQVEQQEGAPEELAVSAPLSDKQRSSMLKALPAESAVAAASAVEKMGGTDLQVLRHVSLALHHPDTPLDEF